jgi:cytoskeletal protein CcmA (bactofilin family)
MTNPTYSAPDSNFDPNWAQPKRSPAMNTESVIDENSNFNGTYRTSQNLRIEGHYEGEIECEGTVTVAEQAVVNAKIRAENVTVAGRFDGEVDCGNRFELMPTGQVSGQVNAGLVAVHEGARFDGQLTRATGHTQEQRFTGPQVAQEADDEEEEEARPAEPFLVNRRREAS